MSDLPLRRWLSVGVPVGVTVLLMAVLIPAVQQAREAARRTQIRNSLHNFGLALHNYHDTHDCFPPGGVIGADGTAYHGWCVMIAPYMDASPLYNRIDLHRPWDDPQNDWLFQTPINWCLSPVVTETATPEGYGLTHFVANPHLLHRNSAVTLGDLTHGLPHTWCLGEAGGEFTPYAYPFNWRPLGTRLNADPGGYGLPGRDGTFLLMADGSVRWWSDDTAPQVLQALAAAPPVPEPGEVAVPPRPARYRFSGRRE